MEHVQFKPEVQNLKQIIAHKNQLVRGLHANVYVILQLNKRHVL